MGFALRLRLPDPQHQTSSEDGAAVCDGPSRRTAQTRKFAPANGRLEPHRGTHNGPLHQGIRIRTGYRALSVDYTQVLAIAHIAIKPVRVSVGQPYFFDLSLKWARECRAPRMQASRQALAAIPLLQTPTC